MQKLEIERKWLCSQTPSSEWLSSQAVRSEEIMQWYDESGSRLRRTENQDLEISWVYTEKLPVKFGVRIENEIDCGDLISQGSFIPKGVLVKTRYYLELNNRVWSADLVNVQGVFVCIVELEVDSEEDLSELRSCHPVFGETVEITDNLDWSSMNLANDANTTYNRVDSKEK